MGAANKQLTQMFSQGREETFEFLGTVLNEVVDLFPFK
jgi:N-acetyl-beta-hexosaminidase